MKYTKFQDNFAGMRSGYATFFFKCMSSNYMYSINIGDIDSHAFGFSLIHLKVLFQ